MKKKSPTAREDVQIVFGVPPKGDFQAAGLPSTKEFIASLKEIQDWFTGFHVEEIELSIGFGAKDGLVTKLFVSFEGKAGCKIILKPNP
ncbi:MAG TPA: hypothetical protein VKA28_02475 [Candidatus Bathyarchaeia archaeon]|nr:hypothetical protein [Candidatus Bathyarchaeia archaeon]